MTGQSNPNTELKLVAIVLPEPLYSIVRDQQNFIAENWNCVHALRTPPHITIIPPLPLNPVEINILQELARQVAVRQKSFRLSVNGYGAFKPRVIFIKPDVPSELSELYHSLREAIDLAMPLVLQKYPDRPYHPHITLAHRDVDREKFNEMWKYYRNKEIELSLEINQFCIMDHSKDGWKIGTVFNLESKI